MRADQIIKFLSRGTSESSKRLIAFRSAMTLLAGWIAMTSVVGYQGIRCKAVDNGLLTAWTFLAGIIAALAREIYRKPEDEGGTEGKTGNP